MIDSLAEQVASVVSTKTRARFRVGRSWPEGTERPVDSSTNRSGVSGSPVTGFLDGCLLLNEVRSKVRPAVRAGPAIM